MSTFGWSGLWLLKGYYQGDVQVHCFLTLKTNMASTFSCFFRFRTFVNILFSFLTYWTVHTYLHLSNCGHFNLSELLYVSMTPTWAVWHWRNKMETHFDQVFLMKLLFKCDDTEHSASQYHWSQDWWPLRFREIEWWDTVAYCRQTGWAAHSHKRNPKPLKRRQAQADVVWNRGREKFEWECCFHGKMSAWRDWLRWKFPSWNNAISIEWSI